MISSVSMLRIRTGYFSGFIARRASAILCLSPGFAAAISGRDWMHWRTVVACSASTVLRSRSIFLSIFFLESYETFLAMSTKARVRA